jgi:O-antigen ligase
MNRHTLKWVVIAGLFVIPSIPFFVSSSLFFPFITTKAFLFRIIVEIIFASWIVLALLDPAVRPRKSWTTYALLIFLAVIALADIFGQAPMKSFWSNSERMEGFVGLLHLGMLFLVMRNTLSNIDWKKWWIASLVASFLMAIYCLFQLFGVLAIHQSGTRVDGTLGNSAYLAVYMLFHIFIALFYMVRERTRGMRWIYGSLALLLTIILYYTATRGAILGLLGGLLIAALLSFRSRENKLQRKLSIGYISLFIIIIIGFFALRNTSFVQSSQVLNRFATISVSEIKTEGRSFIWPMALKGIEEHPLLGWGQENFNYVFNAHYKPAMYSIEPWFDRAHNIFLDWAIAGGLLGLLAYLSLYVLLLVNVWKKESVLTSTDKALITGLLAAYFFHNLFVFDHLISYILFIALLAFVDSMVEVPKALNEDIVSKGTVRGVTAGTLIALLVSLYYFNLNPLMANISLISGLTAMQSGDASTAIKDLESSYNRARLGRPEVVEQIATNAPTLLQSSLSTEDKNAFYTFALNAVKAEADELSTDARYQLLAGTFLENTGKFDDALVYLNKAKDLSPGKQLIYSELAGAYINKGDYATGLSILKTSYELDETNPEAEAAYLVGAIYAGDRNLEAELRADLLKKSPSTLSDDRVVNAYLSVNRVSEVISVFQARLAANPNDPQSYVNVAAAYLKIGDKQDAIATLEKLGSTLPQYKATADGYITQIKNGTLK